MQVIWITGVRVAFKSRTCRRKVEGVAVDVLGEVEELGLGGY